MKKRFLDEGLDSFTPEQVLELLLFYCIPRQNTNELAHLLINEFGSFSQVLKAEVSDLTRVSGIGNNTALFLKLLLETIRYYDVDCKKDERCLETIEACGDYLLPFFRCRCNETVYLLCMDAKCKVLSCRIIGEGSINSAAVPTRRVVEAALAAKATSVVLAHNHPSGIALPSNEDIATTKRIAAALSAVDVVLTDHLIVADDDYVSLAQSGWYRPGLEMI
jgi:DNA repair protein RadC